MADDDVDVADVDELFALPPESFTAARDRLARRLRAEGDRDTAAEVKALRRPTLVAWTLNQLVRRHPEDLDALVAAGEALADAQQEALEGSPGGLREASKARTAAVRRLTGLAEAVLADRATEAHRRELSDALTAASGDPALGAALQEGRLREPPTAAAGSSFGFGLGSAAPAPTRPRPARSAPRQEATDADADAEAEAAGVAARQEAVAEASARREDAVQAAAAASAAREAAAVAEATAAALATALDQARDEAAAAEAAAAGALARAAVADERARAAEAAAGNLDP